MEDTTGHQSANPSIKGFSKAVLVTGGAGYVGSHTCKMLAKNGYVPVTVDRHHREGLVSFGPSYVMSLPQEVNRLDEIITRYNITSCIHFAGSTSVSEICCKSINVLQEQFNHDCFFVGQADRMWRQDIRVQF